MPGAEVVAVSAKTGAGLDELRAALARVAGGGARARSRRRASTSTVSSRFRGIGTVATGTLWSGTIAAGDLLRARARGASRPRAQRPGARRGGRARRGGPARRRQPARRSSGTSCAAATCSSRPATTRSPTGSTSSSTTLDDVPAAVTVHVGTNAVAAHESCATATTRSCGSQSRSSRRAATDVDPAHRDHRRRRRGPRPGAAARGSSLSRLEAARAAATPPRSSARSSHEPVTRPRAAGARPARAARARRGARRRRARPASTTSPRRGSTRCAPTCRRRLADSSEANPLDPGVPLAELLPAEPWAPHVAEPARDRAARREGLPARARARASANARRLRSRARAAARAGRTSCKLDDQRLGAFLEERGRLRRVGDGLAVSTDALRPRAGAAWRRSTRSRSRPSATRSGSAGETAQLLLERYDADGADAPARRRAHAPPRAAAATRALVEWPALEWHGPGGPTGLQNR